MRDRDMTIRLVFVEDASELCQEWPFLHEQLLLAPELWNTYYSASDIRRRLLEKSLQLWVLKHGHERLFWAISEVWTRGDGKQVLVVWWMQGRAAIEHMGLVIQTLERVMKLKGFGAVNIRGRRGWERVLAPFGFKFLRVELTHELET